MKFKLKINGSESPKAEFVGWTPLKCTLTIDEHSGDDSIPVTITAKHLNRKGRIELYIDNSTSAKPVSKVKHDFKAGDKLTFFVAGKF